LSGGFGSASYAKEELRAEIASMMLGDALGIGHDPGQHTAYVGHWIEALEADPREILRASRDAEHIMGYVLRLEHEREQEQQVGRDPEAQIAKEPTPFTVLGQAHLEASPELLVTAHEASARLVVEALDIPVVLVSERMALKEVTHAVGQAYPQHDGFILASHGDVQSARDFKSLSESSGMPLIYPELSATELSAGYRYLSDYAVCRGGSPLDVINAVRATLADGIDAGKELLARQAERQALLDHLPPAAPTQDINILGCIKDDGGQNILICAAYLSADAAERATGVPVVVAQSPETIPDVARAVEAAFPDKDVFVLADLVPEHQNAFVQACEQARCEAIWPELSETDVALGYAHVHDYFDCYPQDPFGAVRDTIESGIAAGQDRLAWRAMSEPEAERLGPQREGVPDSPLGDHVWLYVPAWETEVAQALGARWDADTRSHYVEAGTDLAPFATWAVQHLLAEAEVRPATLEHPYFAGSGLRGEPGARQSYFEAVVTSEDRVLVVARDISGREQNLYDLEAGAFDPRLPHEGGFAWAGQVHPDRMPETLIISADYLSARAVYEATGIPVVVAFEAENLPAVAAAIHEAYPQQPILILGQVGQPHRTAYEIEAAARCGGERVAPAFSDPEIEAGHQTLHDYYQCRYPHVERDIRQTIDAGIAAAQSRRAELLPPAVAPAGQDLATDKTYLHVPYTDKDDAKQLGARWDAQARSWYAPEGTDLAPLSKWWESTPGMGLPEPGLEPRVEFAQAIRDLGLQLDGLPVMDGELHRVPVEGGAPGSRDGAYVGHLDGHPAGYIQNHQSGVAETWKARGYTLSAAHQAALKAEVESKRAARQQERQAGYEEKARACQDLWARCVEAHADDPYLRSKGVGAYGLRTDPDTGKLVVPLRHVEGVIRSLQFLHEDSKRFYPGAQKTGHFHQVGERQAGDPILIAEGYATAASIHEATGRAVVVAFDSGNLKPVAEALRASAPEAAILICGDNDHHLGGGPHNVGRSKAQEAARAVGGQAVVPNLTASELERGRAMTDFNDLHQSRGLGPVQRQVEAPLQRLLQADKVLPQAKELVKAHRGPEQGKGREIGI
jgi:phage/plasmid primase-like uncharacterized protein